mmetsp:Transcript_41977/g.84238  ORF Transcript_41977/g.84238 Transcript_41977/m.84238 type:complete len:233 (-) Transcript_41977:135-833(-)
MYTSWWRAQRAFLGVQLSLGIHAAPRATDSVATVTAVAAAAAAIAAAAVAAAAIAADSGAAVATVATVAASAIAAVTVVATVAPVTVVTAAVAKVAHASNAAYAVQAPPSTIWCEASFAVGGSGRWWRADACCMRGRGAEVAILAAPSPHRHHQGADGRRRDALGRGDVTGKRQHALRPGNVTGERQCGRGGGCVERRRRRGNYSYFFHCRYRRLRAQIGQAPCVVPALCEL